MKTRMSMIARGEAGKILVLALVLLVLGGLLLTPLLGLMSTGLTAGQTYERKTAELHAADAGVEDAIHWLINGKSEDAGWTGDETTAVWERQAPIEINGNIVNVTVEGLSQEDNYKITSTASNADGRTTVVSTVLAMPKFKGCYEEDGLQLGLNQDETIDGDLYVDGEVTLVNHSSLVVNGGVTINGDLTMENNTDITADVICVTGDLSLANHVTITADIHFLGDDCSIIMAGSTPTSRIIGNIWAEGNLRITVSQGAQEAVEVECPDGIYAPNGTVAVHVGKKNSELKGDIYAGETITITGDGNHTGSTYYFDVDASLWTDHGDESTTRSDPPFEIADCPVIPTSPVVTYTYEIT